jgi:hypothetical protein
VQRFMVTEAERQRARATNVVRREVLEQYAGVYEMTGFGGPPQAWVMEVVGDELHLKPPSGGVYALMPATSTVFWVTGQRLEFFLDASGRPTHFVFTIVEGDLKAVRKK